MTMMNQLKIKPPSISQIESDLNKDVFLEMIREKQDGKNPAVTLFVVYLRKTDNTFWQVTKTYWTKAEWELGDCETSIDMVYPKTVSNVIYSFNED